MASAYHEGSLAKATFKLTDFGRAVPFKGLLPGLPEGAAEAAGKEARDLLQQPPQRYNRDGVVVFSDPTYRPPEVRVERSAPVTSRMGRACALHNQQHCVRLARCCNPAMKSLTLHFRQRCAC